MEDASSETAASQPAEEMPTETPPAQPVAEETSDEEEGEAQTASEEEQQAAQAQPAEPQKQMSSKLKILLEKARKQRPNFDYVYYDPANGKLEYHYKIYYEKQLVKLPYAFEKDEMKFNYILFDADKKTADGYCTYVEPANCRYGEGPFKLGYDEWHRPSIQDWIINISYAEILAQGFTSGRLTEVIQFEQDNTTIRMNIDAFYGLPLKIEIDPEARTPVVHDFNDLQVSMLKEEDVLPPLPKHK
ncbi:MAG: hypothetical protein KJ574_04950 [Nanoarchaeota archaeon]|nr:hypothetical protein [Nanoarchaeota archaeon]